MTRFYTGKIAPNVLEYDYWVDTTADSYGGVIKYFNGSNWELVNQSLIDSDTDLQNKINQLQTNKADKATTLSGYGIADAYTKEQTDSQINTAINGLVSDAPDALDTLKELADALNNDADFSTTVTNKLAELTQKDTELAQKDADLQQKIDQLESASEASTSYTDLTNKPQINSVELTGNKTLDDLGIQAKGEYITTTTADSKYQAKGEYAQASDLNNKVDKVDGKSLSTNDFTNDYKTKIDNLGDTTNIASNLNTLTDKVSTLESKVSTLESTVSTLQSKITELEGRITALETPAA